MCPIIFLKGDILTLKKRWHYRFAFTRKNYFFASIIVFCYKTDQGILIFFASTLTNPRKKIMKTLDVIAAILLVIGGLNWFLVGAFEFDLVQVVFGSLPLIKKAVYIVVGLAAFYQIFQWKSIQNRWKA